MFLIVGSTTSTRVTRVTATEKVQATSEVRCVRMLQSADPAYMAREVGQNFTYETRETHTYATFLLHGMTPRNHTGSGPDPLDLQGLQKLEQAETEHVLVSRV